MRWNCPHCGTALAVSDDKLTTSWSFSKCFQCGGYALVRRSDLNMIRIDQVPQGQAVIQSQAAAPKIPTSSLPLMNRAATDHLQQAYARIGAAVNAATDSVSSDDKPVIRPAARRTQRHPEAFMTAGGGMTPGAAATAPMNGSSGMSAATSAAPAKTLPQRPASLAVSTSVRQGVAASTPTAERASKSAITQTAAAPAVQDVAIAAQEVISTGTGAVSAGPAVPVEASKNPAPPAFRAPTTPATAAAGATAAGPAAFNFSIPEPLPEVPETATITRFLPVIIAACSMIAVGSGFYLYRQGQKIYRRSNHHERVSSLQTRTIPVAETASLDSPPATPTEWTDQVAQRAMAPERSHQSAPARVVAPTAPKLKAPAASIIPAASIPAKHTSISPPPAPRLADGASVIAHTALASVASEPVQKSQNDAPSALVVQVHAKNASLRGGPGLTYPILGIASPNANFVVSEWQGQWFKIVIPNHDANGAAPIGSESAPKTAWIRNDLVRLITID